MNQSGAVGAVVRAGQQFVVGVGEAIGHGMEPAEVFVHVERARCVAGRVVSAIRPGDVVSITVFGQRLVILNTIRASLDLLEKRGAQYSDRPVLHMCGTRMGWDQILMLAPCNDHFRAMRRVLHRYLGGRGQLDRIRPYHALIEAEVRRSLAWTLGAPEDFRDIARRWVVSPAYETEELTSRCRLVRLLAYLLGLLAGIDPRTVKIPSST